MTLVQDPCFLLCFLCDAFSFLLFFSCFLGVLRANLGHLRQQPDTGKEQRNPSEIQELWIRDPKGAHGGAAPALARHQPSKAQEEPLHPNLSTWIQVLRPHHFTSPLTHKNLQIVSAMLCTTAPLYPRHRSGWEQTLLRAGSARLHVSPRHQQLLPEDSRTHGTVPSARPSLGRAANAGAAGRQPSETRGACSRHKHGQGPGGRGARSTLPSAPEPWEREARTKMTFLLIWAAKNKAERAGGGSRRCPARPRLLPGAASALNAAPAAGESPAPACAGKASGSPNVPGSSGSVPRAKRYLFAFITWEPSRGTRLSQEGRG